MILWRKFPRPFWFFILGESFLNIAVTLASLVEVYILATQYHLSAVGFSWFGLASFVPTMFGFVFSPLIARVQKHRQVLVYASVGVTVLYAMSFYVLLFAYNLIVLIGLTIVISFLTMLMNAFRFAMVPFLLGQDEELVDSSVNLSYFLTTTLQIGVGLLFSFAVYLLSPKVLAVVIIILLSVVVGLFTLLPEYLSSPEMHKAQHQFLSELKVQFHKFFVPRLAVSIILVEAMLSGLTALLIDTMAVSLKEFLIPIALLGVVNAIRQGGDFLGGFLAPFIKIGTRSFFVMDYLISGLAILLIPFVNNDWLRAGMLFIAFTVIGISGNVFNKLFYQSYAGEDIGPMNLISTTIFSIFIVLSLLIPTFVASATTFWVITGTITFIAGVGLLIVVLFNKEASTEKTD
jgi:hypothetical protein